MVDVWAQQQLKQFVSSFVEADKDGSGTLSMDEVVKVLKKNGFTGGNDEAKKLFRQLDVNRDDKVTRQEFSDALNKMPRITVKEFVLRKAFQSLDKDGSGKLSRAEIEEALQTSGCMQQASGGGKGEGPVAISADKLKELLSGLAKDSNDGALDYEEFLRLMGMEESATVMHYVFKKLDKDDSGSLTKAEIMDAITNESELKLRAAKISDLLVAIHKDSDQKLDYNEFVAQWIKFK